MKVTLICRWIKTTEWSWELCDTVAVADVQRMSTIGGYSWTTFVGGTRSGLAATLREAKRAAEKALGAQK